MQNDETLPQLMLDALDNKKPSLFELGECVCTSNIAQWANENFPEALLRFNLWLQILTFAHVTGCWDSLPKEDALQNRKALEPNRESRIFSAFDILGEKIFIITEWDRSVTTIMLADDY